MIKTVKIYTFQELRNNKPEPVIIEMIKPVPNSETDDLQTGRKFFTDQARILADVLCDTLPGGTLDRLLAELLHRKSSSLVIDSWGKNDNHSSNA